MNRKNILFIFGMIAISSFILFACQKGSGISAPAATISASATDVTIGQSVNLAVSNVPVGTSVVWTSSTTGASFTTNGSKAENATVSFSGAGTYTISAYFVDSTNGDTTEFPGDTIPGHIGCGGDTLANGGGDPNDTFHFPIDTLHFPDTLHIPTDTLHNPGDSTHQHDHDSSGVHSDSTHCQKGDHHHKGRCHIIDHLSIKITVHK